MRLKGIGISMKQIECKDFGILRFCYIDDSIWFVWNDVALSLKYSNPSQVLKRYISNDNKTKDADITIIDSIGRTKTPICINFNAILELGEKSKLNNVAQLKEWIQTELAISVDNDGNGTENICGVSCYEENGIAYLNLEDVAYGLGFTKVDIKFSESGFRNEYVRIDWNRVNKYLTEFKFPRSGGKDYSTSKDLSGVFIPENIFYRLAMKAKNPAAEAFQAKVADEIIPSIRRTGGYISGEKEMDDDELVARAFVVLQKKLEDRDEQIGLLKNENLSLKPKANYFDNLANTNLLTNLRDTAKELGVPPLIFNRWLRDNNYIYYDSKGSIKPYQNKNDGFFVMKEVFIKNGGSRVQTFVTQKGREKFLQLTQQKKLMA